MIQTVLSPFRFPSLFSGLISKSKNLKYLFNKNLSFSSKNVFSNNKTKYKHCKKRLAIFPFQPGCHYNQSLPGWEKSLTFFTVEGHNQYSQFQDVSQEKFQSLGLRFIDSVDSE
jgi:hypothetical protein